MLGPFSFLVVLTTSIAIVADPSAAFREDDRTAPSSKEALAALERPSLGAKTGEGLDIDPSTVTQVGSYPLSSGGRHEVYLARSRNGWTCILEERPAGFAPNGERGGIYGGGCSPTDASATWLKISVSAAGNVDASSPPPGLSIVGIAGAGIGRVAVRMQDGALLTLALNAAGGFHFSGSSGHGAPVAVFGFDAVGRQVAETQVR